MVAFPPFRVDLAEERLWNGSRELALRRKPFAILRYLIAHPGRLVTHAELLAHVWGGAVVSESAVRTHLHELRQVLGEGVIETVIGRGYRFTAALVEDVGSDEARPAPSGPLIVGRVADLAALRSALERAQAGHRQLCFVTGEPGIGKSTLVHAFLDELRDRSGVLAAHGQCIEQYGSPEAYLAVIELLAQLRKSTHGDRILAALIRHAPTFLARVPHLVPDAQREAIASAAGGGTEAKLVREVIEALETMCVTTTLVLVLEDLQWSDVATIDLLSMLHQRRDRAQLLVIATTRHAEIQTPAHPLHRVVRNLVARHGATAIPLERIELTDIRDLIDQRYPGHQMTGLSDVVDRITQGTPLFIASLLDDLVARGMIATRDDGWQLTVTLDRIAAHRPDSVRQLIDIQLDRLTSDEQRVLEAASVVGLVFSVALVAAALGMPEEEVDEMCDGLVRRGLFLGRAGSEDWPDGSLHSRYTVTHGLVLEVCLARGAPVRQQRWHRQIAEALETAYGNRTGDIAHVLAVHFENGQVLARAVHYYLHAGHRDAGRFASSDAARMYRRALDLALRLPQTAERDALELDVLGGLSQAVIRSTPDDTRAPLAMFERMNELSDRIGDARRRCQALVSLTFRHTIVAEYRRAGEISAQLEALSLTDAFPPSLMTFVKTARAVGTLWYADLASTLAALEELTDAPVGTVLGATDRLVVLVLYQSVIRWLIGQPARSLADVNRGLELARTTGDPYAVGAGLCNLARKHLWRRDPPEQVRASAALVLTIPEAKVWHTEATIMVAWADSRDAPLEDAACIELVDTFRTRIAAYPLGATLSGAPLVEILRASQLDAQALAFVDEMLAIVRERSELLFESEFLRLRGELIEGRDPVTAAESYRAAITSARTITGRSLELRAATRLARLWSDTDRRSDGRGLLETALAPFTEGFDTPDLVEASQLLTALDSASHAPQ